MDSIYTGGLGAGPGLSSTGGSQVPPGGESSGAVPSGSIMHAMTPEILPVTGDLSHLFQAWRKGMDRVGVEIQSQLRAKQFPCSPATQVNYLYGSESY